MFLGVPGAEDEVKLWEQTSLSIMLISDNAQCAYEAYYHISLTFCFLDFRNNFYCFQSVYI